MVDYNTRENPAFIQNINDSILLVMCSVIVLCIVIEAYFYTKSLLMTKEQSKANDKVLEESGNLQALIFFIMQDTKPLPTNSKMIECNV